MDSKRVERSQKASLFVGVASIIIFPVFCALFQFSLLSPLVSFQGLVHNIYTGNFVFLLLIEMIVVGVETYLLATYVFSPTYETNLNLLKGSNLIAFLVIGSANFFLGMLLSTMVLKKSIWLSSRSHVLLFLIATLFSSFRSAYFINFQLKFPENEYDLANIKANYRRFILDISDVVLRYVVVSATIFVIAWIFTAKFWIVIQLENSFIIELFKFWTFSDFVLLILYQQLIIRLVQPVVCMIVMAPLTFSLPSVYYASQSLSNAFTLLNALESRDFLTKLFALRQLHQISGRSLVERKIIYTISQPGGHPRNWQCVRNVALELLATVRQRLEYETHCKTIRIKGLMTKPLTSSTPKNLTAQKSSFSNGRNSPSPIVSSRNNVSCSKSMQNSSAELYGLDGSQRSLSSHSPVSFSELYEAKRSFFLPPSLKPRAHDAFSDERKSASKLLKLPVWLDDFVTRIKSTLFKDPPLLSTYDTTCAVFAIKSVANIVAHSIHEDEYGVLQNDLKAVIADLARVSLAIDAYIRASGLKSKTCMEANIYLLDNEIAQGLSQIRDAFGPYIESLNLNPLELEVLKTLA